MAIDTSKTIDVRDTVATTVDLVYDMHLSTVMTLKAGSYGAVVGVARFEPPNDTDDYAVVVFPGINEPMGIPLSILRLLRKWSSPT